MQRAARQSPRMFENPIIDWFSRTHFSVVPLLYVPASLALLWHSIQVGVGVGLTLILASAGFCAWTLAEYWLHRLFFHWIPKARWGERMHFLAHGVHHQWPHDELRLVMPPAVSIALFVTFLTLYVALLGQQGWAVHGGYVAGYVYYDLMHFYLHHGRPRSARLKQLRRHHLVHHFKTPNQRFGVSTRLWDIVFGTTGEGSAPSISPERHVTSDPDAAGQFRRS